MKDETTASFHRSAEQNGGIGRAFGNRQVEAPKQFLESKALNRFVYDESHRARIRMRAHINHAALETGIVHARERNQQLPFEKVLAAYGLRFFLLCHGLKITCQDRMTTPAQLYQTRPF